MQRRCTLRNLLGFSTSLLVIALLRPPAAHATDVSGNCPVGGFTAAGSPWNFTGAVSVPAATTCTVQAGATLNGNGNSLTVDGTLNAVGTSTANRNVVFNDVYVGFGADAAGTLQFCTVNQSQSGAYIALQGMQTVTSCTITGNSRDLCAGRDTDDQQQHDQWQRVLQYLRGGRDAADQQQHDQWRFLRQHRRRGRDADHQQQHDHGE
jgi:hypothetical protein